MELHNGFPDYLAGTVLVILIVTSVTLLYGNIFSATKHHVETGNSLNGTRTQSSVDCHFDDKTNQIVGNRDF